VTVVDQQLHERRWRRVGRNPGGQLKVQHLPLAALRGGCGMLMRLLAWRLVR
jgi:hypothetical protein